MEAAASAVVSEGVEAAVSFLPSQLNLNPMQMINPTVIAATMLIIVATYFLLRKVYVFPYLRVLEEREQIFEVADAQNAEATQSVAQADLDAEAAVAQAAAEAEAMRAEAREHAEEYRRTRVTEATNKAAVRLEEGRAVIAQARAAELERLRAEAVDCVGVACTQLLGGSDEELVEATVDRLMQRQAN